MEDVLGAPAIGRRVRERFDDGNSMIEPGQPCVMSSGRASSCGERIMRELDVQPVDLGDLLGQLVKPRLDLALVVVGGPVFDEWLGLRQLIALGPVSDRLAVGPPRRDDARAEFIEFLFRNVNAEGADVISTSLWEGAYLSFGGHRIQLLGLADRRRKGWTGRGGVDVMGAGVVEAPRRVALIEYPFGSPDVHGRGLSDAGRARLPRLPRRISGDQSMVVYR